MKLKANTWASLIYVSNLVRYGLEPYAFLDFLNLGVNSIIQKKLSAVRMFYELFPTFHCVLGRVYWIQQQ